MPALFACFRQRTDGCAQYRSHRRPRARRDRSRRTQICSAVWPMPTQEAQDRECRPGRQTAPIAPHGNQGQCRVRASPAPSLCKRPVCIGIFPKRTTRKFHRLRMLRIVRTELDPALGLLNDVKLVAFLELEACQELLRQNEADRIADFLDLKQMALNFRLARQFVHGSIPCYTERITRKSRPFNNCFTYLSH